MLFTNVTPIRFRFKKAFVMNCRLCCSPGDDTEEPRCPSTVPSGSEGADEGRPAVSCK